MSLELDGPVLGTFGIGKFDFPDASTSVLCTGLNLAGTIPLAGIISGIFRFVMAKDVLDDPEATSGQKTMAKVWIVRGILECLGVGILLAPIDFGCSMARLVRDHRKASLEHSVRG